MTALDFSRRSAASELMDDQGSDYALFRGCLVDLAKANRWTLGYRPTLAFLDRLHREDRWPADRPLKVLDVGSGYGDLLRIIHQWAARRQLPVQLIGLDLNPWSARAAGAATPPSASIGSIGSIAWRTADVFEGPETADVILSGLFTHHLSDDRVVRFLRLMEERARIGWFVNDLHRHPLPYYGFAFMAKLMGWHPFVQHDGPVSVARAFTRADWEALTARAGIDAKQVEVRWWTPFRLCVARLKPRV